MTTAFLLGTFLGFITGATLMLLWLALWCKDKEIK